jgi:FkbM family methyltransferase
MRRMLRRGVAAVSRRLGRPELLAAVDGAARQAQLEGVAMNAVLAAALGGEGLYVDVGANRGQILAHALRVAPRGRHIAFEPIPALATELAAHFPQIDCRQKALGASPGSAEFCHFTKLDGWSGLRRSPEISDERGRPEYITVEISTLDAELAGLEPTVVKVDVEGAELGVIEGGREVLARARPVVLFEHVASAAALYGTSPGDLWDALDELGYEIFSVTGEGPCERGEFATDARVVNWLARPTEA